MSVRFGSKDFRYTVTEARAHVLKDTAKHKTRAPHKKEGRGTYVCPVCLGYFCGPNPYGGCRNRGPQKGSTTQYFGTERQRDQYGSEVIN